MTKTNNIKPEDWIDAGYKKFDRVKHFRPHAAFGLQKLFSDESGKRYYIAVYVYDNREIDLPEAYIPDFSYAPDVQFQPDSSPTMNVELILGGSDWSIQGVEQQFEDLWVAVGKPYYEKWS